MAATAPTPNGRPNGVAETQLLDGLGQDLRGLRERQRLSLRDLGLRTGFSASFLSQVERGASSASISSLATIAAALGTSLSHLFRPPEQAAAVVRQHERPALQITAPQASYVRLAGSMNQRVMEPLIVTLAPRFEPQETLFLHKGEEFGLILSGTLSITVNDQQYELAPGDSIHFKSDVPHIWANHRDEPVVMLWVNAPPLF